MISSSRITRRESRPASEDAVIFGAGCSARSPVVNTSPTAVGAQAASRGRQVVPLSGNGSLAMLINGRSDEVIDLTGINPNPLPGFAG